MEIWRIYGFLDGNTISEVLWWCRVSENKQEWGIEKDPKHWSEAFYIKLTKNSNIVWKGDIVVGNFKQRLWCCNESILFPSGKSPNQVPFAEVWMPRIQNFCHSISTYNLYQDQKSTIQDHSTEQWKVSPNIQQFFWLISSSSSTVK